MVEFPLALPDLSPDVLICTHDHLDHLDPETVAQISQAYSNCIIAGPESCCEHYKKLGVGLTQIQRLAVGEKLGLPGVIITAVPAYHSDPKPFIDGCLEAGINSFEMTPGKEFQL